ncbi:partitioning defective 3 homolog isoform X2 [Stegodyphus dumicola]|uniref:partitioning defective 3 homolog isoform X2 n=1 Tax=Stegodyphus dumicola TaxID=202533 RepID=UPI0015A91E81|nr:partitioning defective 3 homolog isoform X2 [Stegodyphus dumicola]
MKVTVYFGNVRVIVPCGKGDILVRELMDLAITRYKKATGKPPSSVVTIHNLKSSRDDGILYPDDQLNDVADDREQIIAVFEEENYSPLPQYNCGDVTSTSSVCTGSPDMFSVEVGSHCSIPYNSDVEITEDQQPAGVTPLQVRRGSEPALNCLFPLSPSTDPSKRWSTAVVINTSEAQDSLDNQEENEAKENASSQGSLEINGDIKMSSLTFFRGSGRLSILGNNAETYRWVEAADRQLMKDFNENFSLKLAPPESCEADDASDTSSLSDGREKTIILRNETGPLGIHVVPDYDSKGRDTGLVIQGIEAGGRIDRDGRFHVGDRITEINGKSLQNVSFQTAQEIFKNALKAPQIKLELVRGPGHLRSKTAAIPKKPPPPVYPKSSINGEVQKKADDETALVEGEERAGGVSTKVATVTPTKKVPASATRRIASANTRKIGKMLTIELTKGQAGLGFSITTRDNPAGGNSPIYIKNILPKGAAIEDGRLQPGDRLLEVNGMPMTGKSQAEAVSVLRNIPLGKTVQLVVSRQELEESENAEQDNDSSSKLDEEAGIFPWKHREILTFQIPLTDSHSAGLGVSVKGKSTSTASGSVDLGIFIKSVIPGGAASKIIS